MKLSVNRLNLICTTVASVPVTVSENDTLDPHTHDPITPPWAPSDSTFITKVKYFPILESTVRLPSVTVPEAWRTYRRLLVSVGRRDVN